MEREPRQDLMTHRNSPGTAFAFRASSCHGAVRLRATGRRTLGADLHEHQLFIHLVLDHRGRRVLLGNKSGRAAVFLDMEPDRRAEVVARIVSRARPRLPPGCAEAVERMCVLAAAYGRESACDDMTVAMVWRPRAGGSRGEHSCRCRMFVPRAAVVQALDVLVALIQGARRM
jgi:hypothetical protein